MRKRFCCGSKKDDAGGTFPDHIWKGETKMEQRERTRCEVYSRVVGFLTPISQWNKGKREEFQDRKTFDVSEMSGVASREELYEKV
jgi:ribonucleoside-triphosphate reductase